MQLPVDNISYSHTLDNLISNVQEKPKFDKLNIPLIKVHNKYVLSAVSLTFNTYTTGFVPST